MATLNPRPPYTREEIAALYPQNLELKQVQILLRHGERTPVSPRFQNAGLHPYWPYCTAAKQLRSIVLDADGSWTTLTWRKKLEKLGPNDAPITITGPKGEVDAICGLGELTDRGLETTRLLGQRIRKLYIEQLGFLPEVLDEKTKSDVNLRATPIPRALDSVQQTFAGLYPAGQRSPGLSPLTVVQRPMADETLFPNEGACKRFAELLAGFADRAAQLWNDSPEMNYINKKIGKWMPKDSPVIKVDSHPSLLGIMDTANATLVHGPGTKLPAEFYDPKVLENTDRICTEEWFAGYQESTEYRKLGIGGLLGDLTQHMVENAWGFSTAGEDPFKICLAGCHDTTIAASLTALGGFRVGRDRWPKYTASIAFELFKSKDMPTSTVGGAVWPSRDKTWWFSLFSSPASHDVSAREPLSSMSDTNKRKLDGHYVRIRYDDKPVTLPFCKAPGRHLPGDESFCTLAAFKEATDVSTPKNWKVECKSNLGTSAFPAKIEPAPGFGIEGGS